MYILGVNISHHPSSCLLKDGEVQYFIEEERLNKTKNCHIEEKEDLPQKNGALKTFRNGFSAVPPVKHIDHIIFTSFGSVHHDPRRMELVKKTLASAGITWGEVHYDHFEHHIYHAANAFYMSGVDDAVAIIKDGSGALQNFKGVEHITDQYLPDEVAYREIESIYSCNYDGIKELEKHYSNFAGDYKYFVRGTRTFTSHLACGWLFQKICAMIGFHYRGADAGKLMGMAAYGEIVHDRPWYKEHNKFLQSDNRIVFEDTQSIDADNFETIANFAAKLQQETCGYTIHTIQKVIDKYNPKNIVLSGGYFMNCVNNYKYVKAFPDINFFVDPIAFDCGTALGAAKLLWYNISKSQTKHPHSIYLGHY